MTNLLKYALVAVGFLGLTAGCKAPVGSSLEVPEDAQNICISHCVAIGMELSAVAIMANNVGCICEPQGANANPAAGRKEAVTGGMATIMLQRERQERQRRNNATTSGGVVISP